MDDIVTTIRAILLVVLLTAFIGANADDHSSVTAKPIDRSDVRSPHPAGPLTLPLEVDLSAAQDFIRLGFGLDDTVRFQSTQLLTPRLRTVQAQQLICLVKSYNNFDGIKVAQALTEFRGRVSSIEFGREGSPVLYIELPYWTHQREETTVDTGERIPDEQNGRIVKRLKQVFVGGLAADEFDVEGRRVRIWWD